MADIAAGDVTYTELPAQARAIAGAHSTGRQKVVQAAFGDGALTVAGAGIPLSAAKLGCPTAVKRLRVIADADADADIALYRWNGSETSPALLAATTSAPEATTLTLEVEGY